MMWKEIALAGLCSLLASTILIACGGSGGDGTANSDVLMLFTFQPANDVIGQPNFSSRMENQGGAPSATTLNCPTGISQGSIWVADKGNNRVLYYATAGQPANLVIGQPDFVTTGVAVTAARVEEASAVHQTEGKLAVCDEDNNRILIWDPVPTSNGQSANVVVGQLNFTTGTNGTTANTLNSPRDVHIAGGRLIVSDRLNHRVLIWNTVPGSNGASADVVLGQADFTSNATGSGANEMNRPAGIWSDGARLLVCDKNNHRVLIWTAFPTTNGQPADLVIGQTGFGSSTPGTSSVLFFGPEGVDSDGTRVVVADELNSRVLIYDSFPSANGQSPDVVLGQGDFNHGTDNDDDQDGVTDGPTARTLRCPSDALIDGATLYVVDEENSRVLVYTSP